LFKSYLADIFPLNATTRPAHILPVIIFSQFTGTSLWFAGNAIILDLQQHWGLAQQSLGHVTSAVQLGFICGTLLFALLMIADRFSPRLVFFYCSLAGALANIALLFVPQQLTFLLILRFATGFFLAGIYPVGMKIAAGWYAQGLGRALGYLVGALVLGTAFPHLVRSSGAELPWQQVMLVVRAAPAERLGIPSRCAENHISLTPFSRLGVWLLRPHVGIVYPVGVYSAVTADLQQGK
jgi:MFS family permease